MELYVLITHNKRIFRIIITKILYVCVMKMKRSYIIKVNIQKIVMTFMLCVGMVILALSYYNYKNNKYVETLKDNEEFVVFAMNDLGMHCIQKDYSNYMLLPPANNLKVQVFKKGIRDAKLIRDGIEVKYEVINNSTSSNKINFWKYASDYGYDLENDVGLTGNRLSGTMTLSEDKKYYEATAIPITPYNDGSMNLNPYQIARITVYDKNSGKLIATCDSVVVPVSDEMNCSECHGEKNTDIEILMAHDRLSGTELVEDFTNNIRHKCADCHADNAIFEKGKEGIEPLSQAMHGFHATKMEFSAISPKCYSCHPGPVTKCYRGIMSEENISCDDSNCHGNMNVIAESQRNGREAWLQEPDCGNCHGDKYASNPSLLYRNSYLKNAPAKTMNDIIQCLSCHNSPHSEWPSTLPIDNKIPESLQGTDSYIKKCSVCHMGKGKVHEK